MQEPVSPSARWPRLAGLILRGLGALLLAVVAAAAGWILFTNWQLSQYESRDAADGAPGRFFDVQGYRLHAELRGDPLGDPTGVPLVLIHGFASSGLEFSRITPDLEARRSLILVDLLGFGRSQRVTEPVSAYTHRGQAALVAGVLDALGVKQADLLGSSYGGAIAAQFALDYPQRVRRLVLIDAQIYTVGSAGGQAVANLPLGLNRALTWSTLGGGPFSASLIGAACYRVEACLGTGEDFTTAREGITRIRGTTDALIAFSRAPRDQRVPAEIGQVNAPALVIWGEHDGLVPPAEAERLSQELPQAELVWIPEAGHVPHIERPAAVIPPLLEFLGR